MKEHTSNFETEIKTYGRQQAVQVIYEQDEQEIVLDNESVFSATPNFKASLLKSAMKSLILDCSVEIPVGTRLQFKYGVLVNNAYEYLNFGYYIVNKVEKKEDARSYEMTCYDKMMLTMVDYIDLGIEYPITIRNYIAAICNRLEIDFGSNEDQFVNYDKEIKGELYLDENGDSLNYTFRDVLDEIAQATASVICIDNENKLVVKYPQRNGDYETLEGTSLYIENADDGKIDLELQGNTSQNGTPTPSSPVPVNNVTGLQTITISNGTDSKDYEINLGANLLDIQKSWVNSKNSTQNGLRYILNEDDTISISGTSTNYSGAYARSYNSTDVFMTLKANHKYRLLVEISNKTSNINSRVFFGKANANISDFSIPTMVGNGIYYKDYMPTEDVGLTQYSVIGAQSVGETSLTMKIAIYDITTNLIDKYTKYFTPIELNKIGDYQDYIKKGTGKNLADISQAVVGKNWTNQTNTQRATILYIPVKKGTNYSLVSKWTNSAITNIRAVFNLGPNDLISNVVPNSYPYSNTQYDYASIEIIANTTFTSAMLEGVQIMLCEGSDTTFEPYGYKDKWYIEKNIGKVVLNGSRNWTKRHTGTENWYYSISLDNTPIQGLGFCSHYESAIVSNSNTLQGFMCIHDEKVLRIRYGTEDSVTNYKTWLSSNNVTLYYVFANPTYTLIENEELIEQLDRIHLEQGLNNVMVSSSNLPSSLKMTYVSNLIGIDEDSLKDINVNFGEKYGPINSLVIARAADSDFIYKEDEQSVAEDGLCEVKISDNQILNDDNRVQFIDGIFNQLRGTEFYLNDFSSTGIAYLDLLDYYKIKVFDNTYKCLMLNDELDITQGLQEQIFTDRPEESETEYKSLSKEGKDIRKTMILVDKVNGRITTEIADVNGKYSTLSGTVEGLTSRVQSTETAINGDAEDPNNPGLIKQVTKINSTMLTQEDDAFTAVVSQAQTASDGVKAYDEDDNLQTIRKQIRFDIDGLTISANETTSDDMKLHLTNAAIEFLYQNHAILTINGSTIEFSNASFKKLDLGNYVWQAEDDGSLSLIWEGGNI